MAIQKVILATDGSDNSLRAATFTSELMRNLPEAQVTIVYVAGLPPELQMAVSDGYSPTIEVPLDVLIRRCSGPILSRTEAALSLPGQRVQSEVLVGTPAEEIAMLARSLEADLVICGRRGLSGLKELFMGSVSNRLVHSAPCPVLVVQ